MKKTIAFLAAIIALTWAAHARSPMKLDVLRRDGYGVVALRHEDPYPNELTVRVTINERATNLVLDTGWSAPGTGISLDQDLARALRVQTKSEKPGITWTGAKIANEVAMGNTVVMGNVRITDVPLYFGNLSALRRRVVLLHSLIPVATIAPYGVITNGFLRATSAIIDLPNLQLYLRPPGAGRRAMLGPALKEIGMSEVLMGRSADHHFLVDAEVNGISGKMIIDTGAEYTMLRPEFAALAKAGRHIRGEMMDAAGIRRSSDIASIRSFKVGDVLVYAPNLTVGSGDFGPGIVGAIGMDILGQNWGIIDCGGEKLYLGHVR
jgi:predicted aspartyl protease